jgi:hypothetical protein
MMKIFNLKKFPKRYSNISTPVFTLEAKQFMLFEKLIIYLLGQYKSSKYDNKYTEII